MEGVLCTHLDILTIIAEYTIYLAEEDVKRDQSLECSLPLFMIKRDYVRYLLVCKAFYAVFVKIVWRRVEVGNLWQSTRRDAVDLFEDHKNLIHELSLSARKFYPRNWRDKDVQNAFTYSKTGNKENKKKFSPLLNSVLRHITSPGSVLQSLEIGADMIPRTWWMTLLQVNNLKSLTIKGGPQLSMQIPTGDEELFLQVCSKMSKLHIDFVSFETWPAALRNSDMAAPTKFLGIRHFRIGVLSLGGGMSTLGGGLLTLHNDHREHIMVRGCRNLRSLAWTCSGLHGFDRRNGTEYKPRQYFDGLLQDLWRFQDLRELDVSALRLSDGDLGRLLDSVNELHSLHAKGCEWGFRALRAPISNVSGIAGLNHIERTGYPRQLSSTLQKLDMGDYFLPHTGWLTLIMGNCSSLRTLHADLVRTSDVLAVPTWGCASLTVLALQLSLDLNEDIDSQIDSILLQLSNLKSLSNLKIRLIYGTAKNHTLKPWQELPPTSLKRLRCLEQLRHLDIILPNQNCSVSEEEFGECLSTWPKLRFIHYSKWHDGRPWSLSRFTATSRALLKLRGIVYDSEDLGWER